MKDQNKYQKQSNQNINIYFNILSILALAITIILFVITSNLFYILVFVFVIVFFVVVNYINRPSNNLKENINKEKYVEIITKRSNKLDDAELNEPIQKNIKQILSEREFYDFNNLKQISDNEYEYKPELSVEVAEQDEIKQNIRNIIKNKLNHLIEQSEKERTKTFSKTALNSKKKTTKKKTTKKKTVKKKVAKKKKKATKKATTTKKKTATKKVAKKKKKATTTKNKTTTKKVAKKKKIVKKKK